VLEAQIEPIAPFSLRAVSTWPDPTRRVHGGILEMAYATAAGPARASVWQPQDGTVRMRIAAADPAVAHDRLVEMLGLRVDHRPFLQIAASDPLLRPLRGRLTGLRPWQLSSPEHALVRAVSGQLIRAGEAIRIERRILRDVCPPFGDMHLPADAAMLTAAHPARFERAGLSPARAVLLKRAAKLPWGIMGGESSERIDARLRALPGLGAWTSGVILLHGFGRYEQALVGDLGLIRVCGALLGRPAEPEDTVRLLEPYGEWRGLAASWLLHHPAGSRSQTMTRTMRRSPTTGAVR
jgi:3-methyladenine DNA glycosylase/8-oxoguanine DNA glycosylase